MPAVDASASTHTKLTMLLGGHQYAGKSQLPSKEDLIGQARETLSMHLGLQQEPAFTYSQMQRSCIPQYTIGHVDRMASLHNALQQQQGNSKISVTGASYTGVSVNDCVYHAQRLGEALAKGQDCTGLEHYLASH